MILTHGCRPSNCVHRQPRTSDHNRADWVPAVGLGCGKDGCAVEQRLEEDEERKWSNDKSRPHADVQAEAKMQPLPVFTYCLLHQRRGTALFPFEQAVRPREFAGANGVAVHGSSIQMDGALPAVLPAPVHGCGFPIWWPHELLCCKSKDRMSCVFSPPLTPLRTWFHLNKYG